MYLDLHKTTFSGAIADPSDPRGYSCDQSSSLGCYGFYGTQVLDSVGETYKSISSDDHLTEDFLIIIAIGLFFKLGGIFMIVSDCMSSSSIHRPAAAATKKVTPA